MHGATMKMGLCSYISIEFQSSNASYDIHLHTSQSIARPWLQLNLRCLILGILCRKLFFFRLMLAAPKDLRTRWWSIATALSSWCSAMRLQSDSTVCIITQKPYIYVTTFGLFIHSAPSSCPQKFTATPQHSSTQHVVLECYPEMSAYFRQTTQRVLSQTAAIQLNAMSTKLLAMSRNISHIYVLILPPSRI
jgi:hypothetical protein